jgi:SAM-dependent methyltransferase
MEMTAQEDIAKRASESCSDVDVAELGIRLRCSRCNAHLISLACLKCGFHLRDDDGILQALPPERAEHYARFVTDYERIRSAEGRGSGSDDFYIGLPYCDASGRNNTQWQIRARSYHYLIARLLRPRLPFGARVLDLGAGNCWLSFRLTLVGYKPVAVDLLVNEQDGLGAADHYRKYLPSLFPRFQAELAHLPFQDEQFHEAVFNASFHYAEDAEAALREALRCVRRDGIVIVCDTPWYSCEESGREMVSERRMTFLERYGTPSASIESVEFLTDERLRVLEERLSIRWSVYAPRYGLRWAMRPLVAAVRRKREPARFRIYVAQKATQ